jgi:hypothetical protein
VSVCLDVFGRALGAARLRVLLCVAARRFHLIMKENSRHAMGPSFICESPVFLRERTSTGHPGMSENLHTTGHHGLAHWADATSPTRSEHLSPRRRLAGQMCMWISWQR